MNEITNDLNEDSQEVISSPEDISNTILDQKITFKKLTKKFLDPCLSQAISKSLNFKNPTLIQSKAIPIIFEGKDVLLKGRTGSGKTLAYSIPAVQKVLSIVTNSDNVGCHQSCIAIILTPTRELSSQVYEVIFSLCSFSTSFISVHCTVDNDICVSNQLENIIIGTPKSFLKYIQSYQENSIGTSTNKMQLKKRNMVYSVFFSSPQLAGVTKILREFLKIVILDEADAMTSMGYDDDLNILFDLILNANSLSSKKFQSILCSATLNTSVNELKSMFLYNPAIIKLEDDNFENTVMNSTSTIAGMPSSKNVLEYYFKCKSDEKYMVVYSLLKLSLVPLKCLIFVNSPEKAYKLSLFLDAFSIQVQVICNDLAFSSRLYILNRFNQNCIDILIAVDSFNENDSKNTNNNDLDNNSIDRSKCKSKKAIIKTDESYGIHRGLDFNGLKCVINFDMPTSVKSYVHRCGRIGRIDDRGIVITICDTLAKEEVHTLSEIINRRFIIQNNNKINALNSLELDIKDIECFRYRVDDVLHSITSKKIIAKRLFEIKKKVLKSKLVSDYLQANPEDTQIMNNVFNKLQTQNNTKKHLKKIPLYLHRDIKQIHNLTPIELAVKSLNVKANKNTHKKIYNRDPLRSMNLKKRKF